MKQFFNLLLMTMFFYGILPLIKEHFNSYIAESVDPQTLFLRYVISWSVGICMTVVGILLAGYLLQLSGFGIDDKNNSTT